MSLGGRSSPRRFDSFARSAAARTALLTLLCGCRERSGEIEADAGSLELYLEDPAVGLKLHLAPGWIPAPGKEREARRVPEGRAFLVPPRIVVSREASSEALGDDAARGYAEELKSALAGREGVRINRSAMSARPLGGVLVRDLEIAYEVRGEDGAPGEEVVHRALLFLRRLPDSSRAIVSVTATYLSKDAALVGAEVQSMIGGLVLNEARKSQEGERQGER